MTLTSCDRPTDRKLVFLAPLALALGGACAGGDELPVEVVVPAPDRPLLDMEVVEDYSEAVANRFIELADKLRRRDFNAAREWIAPDFAGHSFTDLASILVAHDELDFEPGIARFKDGGGHGGHNGLRDLVKAMGPEFLRLRIGIGHPGSAPEVINYVLKAPSQTDRKLIDDSIADSINALPQLVAGQWTEATRQLHSSN